ncbi:MAG: hypothetical protein QOH08_1940 [Chloroflexota bacterium]|nr:hypothetical protein [Chloroflexota bacterium]
MSRRSNYGAVYGSWLPGIILIVLGAIFLAENYFGTTLRNWWALFILIPAAATLTVAYGHWRDGDTSAATGPLIAGAGFVFLTVAFLLDLPIGQLWPVFLIIAGLGLLLGRRGWT